MKNNKKSFDGDVRKSFNIFIDWRPNIDMLSMKEKGMFLDMLYDVYSYKTPQPIPEENKILRVVWNSVISLVKRNLKYDLKQGYIQSLNYIDTVQEQSIDSTKTILEQDSTTITNTNTSTSTETITPTNTIIKEDEEFIEGLTLKEYMDVEEEVFEKLNKEEEEVNLGVMWEKIINEQWLIKEKVHNL